MSAKHRSEPIEPEQVEYEYRLTFLDGDPIHAGSTVRGPVEHAIDVWEGRRDPSNDATYGPDIKLQRRPLIGWEDFRVPNEVETSVPDTGAPTTEAETR